ncbi:hypothetical protein BO99DRAFT_223559 [Aspergillus violaceofuscus CBS 115571]|uniref:Uncharacterized protein n=1 Tax=Aspergillus violaceofuscus (strain CBS 115571) TaxID=1450538 RepID=A0A2V5IT43_ASPV1|nr:hypothetical protein BO99DRAFT_223559 [Aspergillus violaceofuscus CBS 115571]
MQWAWHGLLNKTRHGDGGEYEVAYSLSLHKTLRRIRRLIFSWSRCGGMCGARVQDSYKKRLTGISPRSAGVGRYTSICMLCFTPCVALTDRQTQVLALDLHACCPLGANTRKPPQT